jgi:3,4-dihydroxy-2-butanone 4-phosphate synthase
MRRLGIPLLGNPLAPTGNRVRASIEARTGVTTGHLGERSGAHDRGDRRRRLGSGDLAMPGHVFPVQVQRGGVLAHKRHPEGAVDLMRLAGMRPAAVFCTVLCEDGSVRRAPTSSSSRASAVSA